MVLEGVSTSAKLSVVAVSSLVTIMSGAPFTTLDGSIPCPPSHVQDPSGYFTVNPLHQLWLRRDKLIISLLISSMSEERMSITVGKTSSRAIWDAVKVALANPSFSSHLDLHDKLG
ncbi:hypothetical protein LIER_27439 [Lithospermum erythrorhizon]|uniref:Uncharacterized protein n=1 Tax=Lithospermum erythrorhizon TaxID=34254 RepID=A0AAV3RC22_LITER